MSTNKDASNSGDPAKQPDGASTVSGVLPSNPEEISFCSANLGTLLIDPRQRQVIAVDSIAELQLGLDGNNPGQSKLDALFPHLSELEWAAILDRNDKQSQTISTEIHATGGTEKAANVRLTPLSGPPQDLLLMTIYSPREDLDQVSQRDALTGLPDRRALESHYQRWRQLAGEKSISFAVLFMDLDQFKQVNDQHGHAVGDQVLTTLARRWQSCVRDGDLIARYGGDEFVVLLTGIGHREEVEPIISRITNLTEDSVLVDGKAFTVGITIGVALSSEEPSDLEQLIIAADRDMYASKRSKKG